MAFKAISLPGVTVTSGGTIGTPVWDVSDAEQLVFKITSATSAPGVMLQAELTDTGATWTNLVAATSGATALLVSQDVRGISRVRLTSTGAAAAAITAIAAKHVVV